MNESHKCKRKARGVEHGFRALLCYLGSRWNWNRNWGLGFGTRNPMCVLCYWIESLGLGYCIVWDEESDLKVIPTRLDWSKKYALALQRVRFETNQKTHMYDRWTKRTRTTKKPRQPTTVTTRDNRGMADGERHGGWRQGCRGTTGGQEKQAFQGSGQRARDLVPFKFLHNEQRRS